MIRFTCILPILLLCSFSVLFAQEKTDAITLSYSGSTGYYLVERSNWSRYDNGKYTGLTHRETRASIGCTGTSDKGSRFSGTFFVLEETLKDMSRTARFIVDVVESTFIITTDGTMQFVKDSGYPQFRSFPVYPADPVRPGDRWQAEGTRVIDPKNNGKRTILTLLVEYRFAGEEQYNGQAIWRIKAKYATRLDKYSKKKTDDPDLADATGTHATDILVSVDTGATIMILDQLDETFSYADGSSVRFRGSTALFTEAPVPVIRADLAKNLKEQAGTAEKPEEETKGKTEATATDGQTNAESIPPEAYKVEETPLGLRLSVRDIRFRSDSDSILQSESWRLDAIAKSLREIKGGRFLVEGHTAAVGKSEGEKELSVKRAKRILDELVKRGLDAGQFMFTGYGGTRPVADNSNAEGRAQNRRVEITILE